MKKDNKELCSNARKIQDILAKGYHIAEWFNAAGGVMYYLVEDGKSPWEGAYISAKNK